MSLPILALFTRTLREDTRRLATYLMRLALVVIILIFLISLHESWSRFGAAGREFFTAVIFINFAFISLAGISYFSAAITEEKEERTLGLLRMTALSPLAILFGKSTSRVLALAMLLFAQLPFTLLAVTLGGVSLNQIIAAYCSLLAYILFLNNLALFWSVVCKNSGNAAGLTFMFLLAFFLIPPIGSVVLSAMVRAQWVVQGALLHDTLETAFIWMKNASPITRITEAMTTGFTGSPIGFQVLTNLGLGVFFFLVSWRTFDFFTRQEKEPSPARRLLFKRTSRLRRLGVRRAWPSPLIWKDFYFTSGGMMAVLVRFIAYALLIGVVFCISFEVWNPYRGFRFDQEDLGQVMMVVMLILLVIELLFLSSRVFGSEMRWRTLPTIMMLPFSPHGLAYRKLLGCLLVMIPALLYFVVGALLAPASFFEAVRNLFSEQGFWYIVIMFLFMLHLTAYLSLVVKRGALALALAITYFGSIILFFPLGLLGFFGFRFLWQIICPLVTLGLTVLLHWKIGRRLVKVAGK